MPNFRDRYECYLTSTFRFRQSWENHKITVFKKVNFNLKNLEQKSIYQIKILPSIKTFLAKWSDAKKGLADWHIHMWILNWLG